MTAERWQRIKEITADALERPPAGRPAFVAGACAGDAEIAREVLRLLHESESTETEFLSTLPINVKGLLAQQVQRVPCFSPGQVVAGRFRIVSFLNRGGMGEVYSAFDLELQEAVALKTIRPAIASLAPVIDRFKREVKQTRHVTHGNVCRVYDLFSHDQPLGEPIWFLTMELLEGQTLAQRLASGGAMPLHQALPLIREMVAALATAHEHEIVHRDFKPSNVMIVPSGPENERAKVTDFGLALSLATDQPNEPSEKGEGTPAYMAPEQAAGQPVTFASDQFALGLVIAEMLTGERPDLHRSDAAQCRAQLNSWLQSQPKTRHNPRAQQVLRRCLEFRPEDRFRDVRDIVPILDGSRQRKLRGRAIAAGLAVLALLATAGFVAHQDWGDRVINAVRLTPDTDLAGSPSISRDGNWVAYLSDRGKPGDLTVWIQPPTVGTPRRLTTQPAEDDTLSVSPDGKLVAFSSEREGGGIYLVDSQGAGERLLVPGIGKNPAFSPDGRYIAYWAGYHGEAAPPGQVYSIPVGGGPPQRLAAGFADARYPVWSSDGQRILFDGCPVGTAPLSSCTDWWTMRVDGSDVRKTGAMALLEAAHIDAHTPPSVKAWLGDRVLFSGAMGPSSKLWELVLSPKDLRVSGNPRQITYGTSTDRGPSLAITGQLAFGQASGALHLWRIPARASNRDVALVRMTDDPGADCCPSASRDGRWVFFTRKVGAYRQLFRKDVPSGTESLVFSSQADKLQLVANSDGSRVAFGTRSETGSSSIQLFTRNQPARSLCANCSQPTSWFAGDQALFHTTAAGEIALLDVSTGESRVVLKGRAGAMLGNADWSPSHQYLLFTSSTHEGDRQIFAVRFPEADAAARGDWLPAAAGRDVNQPRWSSDGKAFFYFSKRDGYLCIWGQSFDAATGLPGKPFAVTHYHNRRFTPERTNPATRALSVGGGEIFTNVGEVTQSIWVGVLSRPTPLEVLRGLFSIR